MRLRVAAAVLAVPALVSVPRAQTLDRPPVGTLSAPRALAPTEIAQVLSAVRSAMAGKTLKLSYVPGGPGPESLMAEDGRPRFVRTVSGYTTSTASSARGAPARETHVTVTEITEFTRRPARACSGAPTQGELVLEYRSEGAAWTAKARTTTSHEFAATIFDMLAGAIAVESGERKEIGGRQARALIAPFRLPPDAQPGGQLPPDLKQHLWIDTESLLPLRWELNLPSLPAYSMSFTYETLDIRAPAGVKAPDCVS